MKNKKYTRKELINICENAIVPQSKWKNRDTASAMLGVGKCLILLKSGCDFEVDYTDKYCRTDDMTIWIQFYVHDFVWFEYDFEKETKGSKSSDYHFYLPTLKRLKEVNGEDWY